MDPFSKKGCHWTKTMETQKMKNALQQQLPASRVSVLC